MNLARTLLYVGTQARQARSCWALTQKLKGRENHHGTPEEVVDLESCGREEGGCGEQLRQRDCEQASSGEARAEECREAGYRPGHQARDCRRPEGGAEGWAGGNEADAEPGVAADPPDRHQHDAEVLD